MANRHSAITIITSSSATNSRQTSAPSHEHDELSMMFSTSPESTGLSYSMSMSTGDDGGAAPGSGQLGASRSQVEWLARAADGAGYEANNHRYREDIDFSDSTRSQYSAGMSTSAEIRAFTDDPRSVRLSALTGDIRSNPLSVPQYALSSHPKTMGTSGFRSSLDRGGRATAMNSPFWNTPSTPASPIVSEPASPPSIASSSNQRGIRIANHSTGQFGSREIERMPLRSLDSTFSYGSYSTDITSPSIMSFNGDETSLYPSTSTSQYGTSMVTDRKGKGKATQVDAFVDSPPMTPPGIPLPSTSFPGSFSSGQVSHGQLLLHGGAIPMTTSPDGLGHYSPDVADLLHIPPFELEPRAFDWDEFERSIRNVSQHVDTIFHSMTPPTSPSSTSSPGETLSTSLALGIQIPVQKSSSRDHSDTRNSDVHRPVYFPAYE
ncbi:hypothetical protein FRC17_003670, partial [Serendipita sp. 399]